MSSGRYARRGTTGGVQVEFHEKAPPVPTDGLFFALFPDAAAVEAIVDIQRQLVDAHELSGRPIAPERLHVTLQHLGDFAGLPSGLVTSAERAAASLRASGFEIHFDQAGSFASRRRQCPCVLTCSDAGDEPGIHDFQRVLTNALLREGIDLPDPGRFTPHVTLLYDRHPLETTAIKPLGWLAREFVLIQSLLGQTRHIVLGRWSLTA
ncbi:MAG: 2'-5' RNA ligase family protein [Rhodanobacteraceae bacterium]|nr:2'-5' RNA ligase family protein [Xanthomonadales bacterium]MCP5478413.1 2'-5' RNA ligase family protein [Rhodanobacteraceae bacterium]HPF72557.1 2'-5' RNA ligase family protein [Xanthomonadaceae bacterium]HRX99939.1 2'-5' RNA ligase family protein [Xanthomonadaceae bacterium]